MCKAAADAAVAVSADPALLVLPDSTAKTAPQAKTVLPVAMDRPDKDRDRQFSQKPAKLAKMLQPARPATPDHADLAVKTAHQAATPMADNAARPDQPARKARPVSPVPPAARDSPVFPANSPNNPVNLDHPDQLAHPVNQAETARMVVRAILVAMVRQAHRATAVVQVHPAKTVSPAVRDHRASAVCRALATTAHRHERLRATNKSIAGRRTSLPTLTTIDESPIAQSSSVGFDALQHRLGFVSISFGGYCSMCAILVCIPHLLIEFGHIATVIRLESDIC